MQTPLQRFLGSNVLDAAKEQELTRVMQALDSIRLLQQLEHLQQALWRHVVLPAAQSSSTTSDHALRFNVKLCAEQEVPCEGITAAAPSLAKKKRKVYQKSQRLHDWRTRKGPFEGMWDQITTWLTTNPERTGVSIFQELQRLYPGRFSDTQVRTLQRGLQKVRAHLLVTFDDQCTQEVINGHPAAPVLRAVAMVGVS